MHGGGMPTFATAAPAVTAAVARAPAPTSAVSLPGSKLSDTPLSAMLPGRLG